MLQAHLCEEGGRLSAPSLMSSPLRDRICGSKKEKKKRKKAVFDWHTGSVGLCNATEQERTTQEMRLHNGKGTFTQPTGQPGGGKKGFSGFERSREREHCVNVMARRKRRVGNAALAHAVRLKGTEVLRLQGQKEPCVNRDAAAHYHALSTSGLKKKSPIAPSFPR